MIIPIIRNYLLSLEEDDLHQLLKDKIYKDLMKNSDNHLDVVDRYSPKHNLHIELKCRKEPENGCGDYGSYMIEKHKYDDIMKYENVSYICSGGNGIFEWDLKTYPEKIVWQWESEYRWTTRFSQQDKKNKLVTYLRIDYAKWLHPKILLYPFDFNRNI